MGVPERDRRFTDTNPPIKGKCFIGAEIDSEAVWDGSASN